MDAYLLLKTVAAFAFVMGLMVLLHWGLKRAGLAQPLGSRAGRRLKIVETLALDTRRRAVLIRRDDREHLVILGPSGEVVVESGIAAEPEKVVDITKEQRHALS